MGRRLSIKPYELRNKLARLVPELEQEDICAIVLLTAILGDVSFKTDRQVIVIRNGRVSGHYVLPTAK